MSAVHERCSAAHTIRVALPVAACQRLFTPAGEELWVDGWAPRYLVPADGRTERGMVFTTGQGDELTFWTLVEFDTVAHRACYARVTPASRSAIVEVQCREAGTQASDVEVRYTVTALTPQGVASLDAYRGAAFVAMIEDWRSAIEARLPALRDARVR